MHATGVSKSCTDVMRALVSLVALALAAAAAPAQDRPAPIEERGQGSVESRLGRIERALAGEGLLDLSNQLAQLEREVRRMRGELENQAYLIEQLKRTQDQLYRELARVSPGGEMPLDVTGAGSAAPGLATDGDDASAPADDDLEASADAQTVRDDEVPAAAAPPSAAPSDARDDQIALTGPVRQATASDATPGEREAVKTAYQAAFDKLKAGEYESSVTAFRDFISAHPDSAYADNAQYWLGEAFYVTNDYTNAIAEYEKLLAAYPKSQKYTHALLKIGYSQEALGETEAARSTLEALSRDFPNTTAARLAAERLKRLPGPDAAASASEG